MSTVQQAAISYFGLPEGATLVEGGPIGHFAFIIPLTEEHLRGIADRMKALTQAVPYEDTVEAQLNVPTREQLRTEWSEMTPREHARYGSFGRYCAQSVMGTGQDDALMHGGGA